jgi:hypothetical protein
LSESLDGAPELRSWADEDAFSTGQYQSNSDCVCMCVWRVRGLTSVMLALLVYHYDRYK